MTLAERTQALIDLVEEDRSAQCAAILAQAQAQADALRASARTEALTRVREAMGEERRRLQARLAAAQAELRTRRRLHAQRHAAAWLELGWRRLPDALRARWHADASRRLWIAAALGSARRALPAGAWHIVHAEGWPEGERGDLAQALRVELGVPPQFTLDASVEAGLSIGAFGTRIDATLAGLMADRDEIGARLLGELGEA